MSTRGTCEWCGRAESVRPGRKYCSQTCFGMAKRNPLRACQECGSLFPPRKRVQRFCSPVCRGKFERQRIGKVCEHCGGDFEVTPSTEQQRFCSLRCKGEASRIERAGARSCVVCGDRMERRQGPTRLESNRRYELRQTCSEECGVALATEGRIRARHVGRRTLLARTCNDCGQLLPAPAFHASGDGIRSYWCRPCEWARLSPDRRAARLASGHESYQRRQDESRPTATRHGYQWTGAELELVLRDDLTRAELAAMLGRTLAAVAGARQKARHDPKWIAVVGAGRR